MNLLDVFMELEDSYLQEAYQDRQSLINEIIGLGYIYKFDKYTDQQLYCILNWARSQQNKRKQAEADYADLALNMEYDYCENCGRELNPLGECPTCDLGDDSIYDELDEGIFDSKPSGLTSWKAVASNNTQQQTVAPTPPPAQPVTAPKSTSGKHVVTIVYDTKAHKLRARADDGTHGEANVAFPNNLRNAEGQQYEVDDLIWNGKNYRASGSIKPVNSVANTQNNINENIDKENPEMNFTSVLEELNRLYEADETEIEVAEEEAVEAPVEEPAAEEVPAQLVLECAKCGALVIKPEADVVVDEATDLANVEDECAFCEEKEGFKVIGTFAPYAAEVAEEAAEEVAEEPVEDDAIIEESLLTEGKFLDNVKKVATRVGADAATIVRCFAELGDIITGKDTKFYDFAEYVENKAVLKALMNGNETVLNTCTKEDIEDLKQSIEDYKKDKAGQGEEELDEFLDADINLSLDGGQGNDVDVL